MSKVGKFLSIFWQVLRKYCQTSGTLPAKQEVATMLHKQKKGEFSSSLSLCQQIIYAIERIFIKAQYSRQGSRSRNQENLEWDSHVNPAVEPKRRTYSWLWKE
jgi:hypothetical protein